MTIRPNADLLTQDWLLQGELERLATRSEREFMRFTLLSEFSEWNGGGGVMCVLRNLSYCFLFPIDVPITETLFFFFFSFTDGKEAKNNTTTCTNTVEIYKKN